MMIALGRSGFFKEGADAPDEQSRGLTLETEG